MTLQWTPDRPTKAASKYWLSLHPSQRKGLPACVIAEPMPSPGWQIDGRMTSLSVRCSLEFGHVWINWDSKRLQGALWREYETPSDPHEAGQPEKNNVVPFLREESPQ